MVPQNPSQARGGPKNTHQGGACGWENLQVVCVWPQQKAGERPVSPSPLIYHTCGLGNTTCGPGTPIQDVPFSHGYLREPRGGGVGIFSGQAGAPSSLPPLLRWRQKRNSPRATPVEPEFCPLLVLLILQRLRALPRKACLSLSPLSFFFLGSIWVPRPQPPTFGRL